MDATLKTIWLSGIHPPHLAEIRRMAEEDGVSPLTALEAEGLHPPVLWLRDNGDLTVVDGFHRLAGLVAADEDEAGVVVISGEGCRELADEIDCDCEIGSCEPLDAIYAAAGIS